MLDLDRLKSQLLTSGIQVQNNALFQVINLLIDASKELQSTVGGTSSGGGIPASITALQQRSYWTELNETPNLPNSREVIAGSGIALDYSVYGEVTLSSTVTIPDGYWTLLTDGDPDETDFIFANGEPIAMFIPL